MLDIQIIRNKPEIVRADLKKRGDAENLKALEELIEKDKQLRQLSFETAKLKQKRNALTKEIALLKKEGKDAGVKIKEAEDLPKQIEKNDREIEEIKKRVKEILMRLPNILHESVPLGKDENDNVEIRREGTIPKLKFSPKGHEELALSLDGIDIQRAAKIAGARFFFLKNELARLDMALQLFAVDVLLKKGFVLAEPPLMMGRKPYEGVTDLGDFETMMYKVQGEDLYLIATSEHPLVAAHMNEIIDEKKLPVKYCGVSPCFRKEAGTHGKDTKGIFRVHQFNKVEQLVICKPEDSWKLHEELIKNAEEIFKQLKIPHRIVNVCTGDIGTVAAKKYDLEAWMPAQSRFREVVSCSNCTDYQARRLNIRYGKLGHPKQPFAHTINSTAIATGRAIVAILENFQQADGSVIIPAVLQKYMAGIKRLTPKKKKMKKKEKR